MHKTGMVATFTDNFLDTLLLSKGLAASNELNVQRSLRSDLLGMVSQFIAQRLCPASIVKEAKFVIAEITSHCLGMTDIWKGTRDDNTVKAGNDAANLILMEFYKTVHDPSSNRKGSAEGPEYDIFLVPAMPG
jgi:hypothetical protein